MNNKLEKIIFKFLDEKNFIVKETPDNYYFLENKDDEYSQIRIGKNNTVCYIYIDLIDEVESFFSISYWDSKDVITQYVESRLNIVVSDTVLFKKKIYGLITQS